MADDFADIGSNQNVIDFQPNWQTAPSEKSEILVAANIYPGSIHDISFYREPVKELQYTITDLDNKLYALLVAFADKVGRLKSFWVPDLFARFEPLSIALDGSYIDIEKNEDLYLHGQERIFIRKTNDDRIARKIDHLEQLPLVTRLHLVTPITGLLISDIILCTLFYYCRFASDTLEIRYTTDTVASTNISFVELFEEYSTWL